LWIVDFGIKTANLLRGWRIAKVFSDFLDFTPGGEIASRLAYTQKSRGQNLPGRPLPRGVTSSVPVSDTGGPGAKPGGAATFHFRFAILDLRFGEGKLEARMENGKAGKLEVSDAMRLW
jgi:hypothetical protein